MKEQFSPMQTAERARPIPTSWLIGGAVGAALALFHTEAGAQTNTETRRTTDSGEVMQRAVEAARAELNNGKAIEDLQNPAGVGARVASSELTVTYAGPVEQNQQTVLYRTREVAHGRSGTEAVLYDELNNQGSEGIYVTYVRNGVGTETAGRTAETQTVQYRRLNAYAVTDPSLSHTAPFERAGSHQANATGNGATMDQAVTAALLNLVEDEQTRLAASRHREVVRQTGQGSTPSNIPRSLVLSSEHGAALLEHVRIRVNSFEGNRWRAEVTADATPAVELTHVDPTTGTVTTEHITPSSGNQEQTGERHGHDSHHGHHESDGRHHRRHR